MGGEFLSHTIESLSALLFSPSGFAYLAFEIKLVDSKVKVAIIRR